MRYQTKAALPFVLALAGCTSPPDIEGHEIDREQPVTQLSKHYEFSWAGSVYHFHDTMTHYTGTDNFEYVSIDRSVPDGVPEEAWVKYNEVFQQIENPGILSSRLEGVQVPYTDLDKLDEMGNSPHYDWKKLFTPKMPSEEEIGKAIISSLAWTPGRD